MRVPNYKLDDYFARLEPVENYNGTIEAYWSDNTYCIRHWDTLIAAYRPSAGDVELYTPYTSQTTSALLGRIVRALPRGVVEQSLLRDIARNFIDTSRANQVRKMMW